MRNNGLLRAAADTIRRFAMLRPGERVLVALSGGADSVSLLLVLQKLGYEVRAFHLNHCLRGAESDRDEAFCRALCAERGVPLNVGRCDIAALSQGKAVEETARRERYRLLEQAAEGDKIATAHTAQIELMDFKPYEVSTDVTAAPAIDIDKIAEDVTGSPVNATVSKEDGKTIIPGKSGVQFDVEKAKEIIGDGSQASYSIPVTITQPTITEAVLRERLFRDTLARTATNLNEGNAPRTNNVRLAAKAINGTILNPGDVFSYNTVVGERTQARGYQEAHAYSGGKIIDEFGGGVCQPSSTLYMAVLRADLEVVERHNHSFTVSYTPLGEDATVDYGNLDFRFANNTAYPIKILAEQTGGQMIMTIIGTKTSDKTVATRTEVLETYKPETVEKQDSSLAAGETQVETSGITGYSTRTYKVITENGKTTEVLANKSTYSKRDEVVSVGTGS